MAFPYTPVTHGASDQWTAAKANALELAVRDSQQRPAVRVFHNTTQSISSGVDTAIAFNSERFDTFAGSSDTQHDTVTNNTRLTCRYAGKYIITGNFEWASTPANSQARIRLNGSTTIARVVTVGTAGATLFLSTLYDLAVNDYVELLAFQGTGAGLNVTSNGNWSPEFMMVHVA